MACSRVSGGSNEEKLIRAEADGVKEHKRKQRTLLQNKSLHVYFDQLAAALNDAGWEMKKVLEEKAVDIPWSGVRVKEVLWRPIQEALTGKHSTTEINTVDPTEIYAVLDRHLSEKFGVHVEWPCEETMAESQRMAKR